MDGLVTIRASARDRQSGRPHDVEFNKMASMRSLWSLRQLGNRSQALVPRRSVHVENAPGNVSSVTCAVN